MVRAHDTRPRPPPLVLAVAAALTLAACGDGASAPAASGADPVLRWNTVALDATRLDHTPVGAGETRIFGEQLGPTRASRALAMIHIAMADAVAMIDHSFATFFPEGDAPRGASVAAAVAQAAHDTAVEVYPSQAATFDAALADDLAAIPDGRAKGDGIAVGRAAAVTCLDARNGDGSELSAPGAPNDYVFGEMPGEWRADPLHTRPHARSGRSGAS